MEEADQQQLDVDTGRDVSATNPRTWSVEEVAQWLDCKGFAAFSDTFRKHDISGAELFRLDAQDFTELGIFQVGVRKRIQEAISILRSQAMGASAPSSDSTVSGWKLFVGQLPRSMTAEELRALFADFGEVLESVVLRSSSGASRGCGFVRLSSEDAADRAIAALHDRPLSAGGKLLQVQYARSGDPEGSTRSTSTAPGAGARGCKLFVGQVPHWVGEARLRQIFERFGTLAEVAVLVHPDGRPRGCAFVRFDEFECAARAVEALGGGRCFIEGAETALRIDFASKQGAGGPSGPASYPSSYEAGGGVVGSPAALSAGGGMRPGSAPGSGMYSGLLTFPNQLTCCPDIFPPPKMNVSLFGNNLPGMTGSMGGLGGVGASGGMPGNPMQANKAGMHSPSGFSSNGNFGSQSPAMGRTAAGLLGISGMYSPVGSAADGTHTGTHLGNHGGAFFPHNALQSVSAGMSAGGYGGGAGSVGAGILGAGAGFIGHKMDPLASFRDPLGQAAAVQSLVMDASFRGRAKMGGGLRSGQRYKVGPPGSNIFIYNLPQDMDDPELGKLCLGFGEILSTKVYRDRNSGCSKGFGFVSFASPESAAAAIRGLHDSEVLGRRLKVQLKDS
mmetsp:Transcript_73817/g.196473  ORF Transcript_73817/g.196473 Transcript_73817/m.196473 type:complete len:617 (+) Transcript_73817:209-2059(+)